MDVRIVQSGAGMSELFDNPTLRTYAEAAIEFLRDGFDRLRELHFPPERNYLSAHLTLFHKLPGKRATEISAEIREGQSLDAARDAAQGVGGDRQDPASTAKIEHPVSRPHPVQVRDLRFLRTVGDRW